MNQLLENNRNTFLHHESDLLVYLMNIYHLKDDQCYMITTFLGNKFFTNKYNLKKCLVSLAPTFEFNVLSELALYLIENEIIVDVTVTSKLLENKQKTT
jgi:hypothetical protein